MNAFAAYIRVSTSKQDLEVQREAILNWARTKGVEISRWYEDVMSGATADRPGLQKALADAEAGAYSMLVIFDLSRLGRSMRDIVDIVMRLKGAGVRVVSIKDGLDSTNDLVFNVIAGVFSALAEAERRLIRERTLEGLRRAREIGKKLGPKFKVDPDKLVKLLKAGLRPSEIAEVLGVHRATVYRHLKRLEGAGVLKRWYEVRVEWQESKK